MFWFDTLWGLMSDPTKKRGAKYRNNAEFRNVYMQLYNLAVSRFEWKNLPDTCNERYLEMALLTSGMAGIADDAEKGYISLRGAPASGTYNIYGEPTHLRMFGWNGFNKVYTCYMQGSVNTDAKAVICRDNPTMYPYISYIATYAIRIADIMRSIDVAAKKLKVPYFIVAEQAQISTIEEILNQVEGNEEKVVMSNATNPNAFDVKPTQVRGELLTSLWETLDNTEARLRAILGIESAPNQDKKERLITDEVNSNNMFTDANLRLCLRQRKIFCENVNEMWGLDISVDVAEHMKREEVKELGAADPGRASATDGGNNA